jgi:cardiolipin synthase
VSLDFLPNWSFATGTVIGVVLYVAWVAIAVAALGIIPGNRKPSTGMAWLLLVLIAPFVGFLIFLLFGSPRIERRRHERQREVNEAINARTHGAVAMFGELEGPSYLKSVVELNHRLGALPMLGGNDVELLTDYYETLAEMTTAVEAAEHFVNIEFYIMAWDAVTDPLFKALVAATDRGVKVRLLFDHLGSRGLPVYKEFVKRLSATQIDWHPMLPIQILKGKFRRPDLRNHRKLMVVDGRVGFTGSLNVTERGYNKPKNHKAGREWVELMMRLNGPVVAALDSVFAGDWYAETSEMLAVEVVPAPETPVEPTALRGVECQVVPSGPGFVTENNLRLFTTLIYQAEERISITSPYFVPDESLLYAVTTAVQRGIPVELFVSEQSDQFMVGHAQASYYRALLEAGVSIYLYPPPWILHSKFFSVDDDLAVVGSSNMDLRSFALNYEISTLLIGPEITARVREVEDSYRAMSRLLTLEEWSNRPARLTYVDNVMRLSAALQ